MGNKCCSCGNRDDKGQNEANLVEKNVKDDYLEQVQVEEPSKAINTRDRTAINEDNQLYYFPSFRESEFANNSLYNLSSDTAANFKLKSKQKNEKSNFNVQDEAKIAQIYKDNQANKIINAYRKYIARKYLKKNTEHPSDNTNPIINNSNSNINNSNINNSNINNSNINNANIDPDVTQKSEISNNNNLLIDPNRSIPTLPPLLNVTNSKTSRTVFSNDSLFGVRHYKNESKYIGQFQSDKCHGWGKYITSNNDVIAGEFKGNDLNGFFLINRHEGASYVGEVYFNLLQGIGTETFKDGSTYSGEYVNNKKGGIGTYKWGDGSVYKGEWKSNNPNGYGYYTYYDGRYYEGEWKNGMMNGIGCFKWKDGKKYLGMFEKDKRNGFGIFIWKNPLKVYIGYWKSGRQNGYGKVMSSCKEKYFTWKNSKRERCFNTKEGFFDELAKKVGRKYEKFLRMPLDDIISIMVEC